MFTTVDSPVSRASRHASDSASPVAPILPRGSKPDIGEDLRWLSATLAPQRRLVRAGEYLYRAGDRFDKLYVNNSGFNKLVSLSTDGREQVVGLKFKGDWMGLDGIASGRYACDAVAMDVGEVWAFPYESLLKACLTTPSLMTTLHQAMSRAISEDRQALVSICALPADARVAGFLRHWAESMADRGMRIDQITLPMSRGEIGNYLGLTLETVSRAFSRLAKNSLIQFVQKGGRDIRIPRLESLGDFVRQAECH